ncbi:MAG TPA: HAD family phosphatase, partial [Methylomirabilota bacterium]|nr:HAD family phosphatase [Methylomirabilota bacterium]
MQSKTIDAVVFDLGGVLIDWNPRHLYRKLFEEEAEMEHFLTEICSPVWNV